MRPLIPLLMAAMERHGHLALDAEVRARLAAISAATIDRVLAPVRTQASPRGRRRSAPSLAIRRSIPVRTFSDWGDPSPGSFEADLVAHSGPTARGSFIQTLVMTDVATGWTECAPLLFREQHLLGEVLSVLRAATLLPVLGLDTDNDSVFMNETIKSWCEAANVVFTRSRPYRKNDQAHVEQKNGAIVRRMVGYRRLKGLAAAEALAMLYRPMRLFVNFFQPSVKLAESPRSLTAPKRSLFRYPVNCELDAGIELASRERRPAKACCSLVDNAPNHSEIAAKSPAFRSSQPFCPASVAANRFTRASAASTTNRTMPLRSSAKATCLTFWWAVDIAAATSHGYDATADAGTMFGEEKAGLDLHIVDGRAIFFLTKQGWKVSATAAGTKYWVDTSIN